LRLEPVFEVPGVRDEELVPRVVREDPLEPLLLTGEEGGPELLEVLSSLDRMLDRPNDEAILQPNGVVGIALTSAKLVDSRTRDPEVRGASTRVRRALLGTAHDSKREL